MPIQIILVTIVILLLAAAPLPYGFYMLVRIVAVIVFSWAAVISVKRTHITLAVIFGLAAILFNPLFKVHLDKNIWLVLDILAALLLLATMKKIKA